MISIVTVKHSLKLLLVSGCLLLSKSAFPNADSVVLFRIFDTYLNNIYINSPRSTNPKVRLVDIDLFSNNKTCGISLTHIFYKKEVALKPFKIYFFKDHYFLLSFKNEKLKNEAFDLQKQFINGMSISIDSVLDQLYDKDEDYTGRLFITYIDHFTVKKNRLFYSITNRTYYPSSLCPDKYQIERVYKPLLSEASKNFLIKTNFYTPKKLRQINRKRIKILFYR